MLGRMEQPSRMEQRERERRQELVALPVSRPDGQVRPETPVSAARARWAGRRVLAGMQVAFRLAERVLEEPELGPRYLRTAFLQGVATVLLAALGLWIGDGLTDVLANRKLGALEQMWAVVAAIYGALVVAQWGVVALSREFHDAISREASLRVGLEPEDPPRQPKVRLDMRWMRAKLKRRWRALWVLGPGLAVAGAVSLFMPYRGRVYSVLTALWAASWWVVWTAAKSARAWVEPAPSKPWFLRGWDVVSEQPVLQALGFRAFGRLWHRVVRTVWAPVAFTERMPLEFTGLSLVRLLGSLPVVKFFVRPLVPVAAGLLLARGPEAAETLRELPSAPRLPESAGS
jgi:hypothetical protein